MKNLVAAYPVLFEWQFTSFWFYIWLVFGIVMGWPSKYMVLGWLIISIAFIPIFLML